MEVAFAGNLAVHCSGTSSCCKRYYFKLNGNKCTAPAVIDGLVSKSGSTVWPNRHKHVEGYCENIPAGNVTMGFYIGDCRSQSWWRWLYRLEYSFPNCYQGGTATTYLTDGRASALQSTLLQAAV